MPRILIVDDERAILALLSMAFTSAGYDVRTAPDGDEAMRLCAGESFDVVLSDVVMPSMNGHQLIRAIAERYPATRAVLMSGYDVGCEGCPLARQCQVLSKPFRTNEVVAAVNQMMQRTAA
jgi:DNA-binding NtrC family response regulator